MVEGKYKCTRGTSHTAICALTNYVTVRVPFFPVLKCAVNALCSLQGYSLYKCTHTHTHTHTNTYTCSDLQTQISTMNFRFQEFYMQPWTYTSEFSPMNMDSLCLCVKFNYLTMDYPYPCRNFLFICMPMRFATEWRVSDNRGLELSIVEGAYKHTRAHTHTHTHTHFEAWYCLINYQL